MTLSTDMAQKLLARLATTSSYGDPIRTTGPNLRCRTVEDAERAVVLFRSWLRAFDDLAATTTASGDDRAALLNLYETFGSLVADLEAAIRKTRDEGVPWEATKDVVAARKIEGEGTIDPRVTIVTAVTKEKP